MMGEMNDKAVMKFTLVGEPARILRELKNRGVVQSYRDAVSQGLLLLYDETLRRELQMYRVSAAKRLEELN